MFQLETFFEHGVSRSFTVESYYDGSIVWLSVFVNRWPQSMTALDVCLFDGWVELQVSVNQCNYL